MVEAEVHDGWAEVWLDRAERRNALSHALVDELLATFDVVQERGATVVVLGGRGPVFCAGGDRSEVATRPVASARLLERLSHTSQVVVARVEGPAVGAGAALVRACPVALGTPAAAFVLPEASMGNLPVPLPHLLGGLTERRALAVALTGEAVGSAEALAAGLLTEVAAPEEIDDLVAAWAGRLVAMPDVADQARRFWQRGQLAATEESTWIEEMVRS